MLALATPGLGDAGALLRQHLLAIGTPVALQERHGEPACLHLQEQLEDRVPEAGVQLVPVPVRMLQVEGLGAHEQGGWQGLGGTSTSSRRMFPWPAAMRRLRIADMGPTGDVGDILREEVLVPPQPLPPSLFVGTESFDLEHADRDWNKLNPRFRNTVLQLFLKMEARGFPMALLEGYRSVPIARRCWRRRAPASPRPGVARASIGPVSPQTSRPCATTA